MDYQRVKTAGSDEDEVTDNEDERSKGMEDAEKQKMLFGYPAQVFFILGNEFCERFTYYGIHAILVIYLMTMLEMEKGKATVVYHSFNMLCYFSPIIGAIVADSLLGKYKTILCFSIFYALGNLIVAVTAIPSVLNVVHVAGPIIGLIFIGLGTGGIKPCVSAFGGDQFQPGDEDKLETFFSLFYFAINFGSLISTLVTPILRADVKCFGHDCFPLGFGVPFVLMLVSLLLFLAGSPLYKKVPPKGNMLIQVSCAVGSAINQRALNIRSGAKKDHWIEWASDTYSPQLKSDIKALFKVLFMFLPLPLFWTLFDQHGSTWVIQAMDMNGDIGVFGTLKPDQMQASNAIFVLLLIPFAQKVIYPIAGLCGMLKRPLQKMVIGGMLASLAFFVAGCLQVHIDRVSHISKKPSEGLLNYRLVNTLPCKITAHANEFKNGDVSVSSHFLSKYFHTPSTLKSLSLVTSCPQQMTSNTTFNGTSSLTYTMVVSTNQDKLYVKYLKDETKRPKHGYFELRFLVTGGVPNPVTVTLDNRAPTNLSSTSTPEYTTILSTKEDSNIKAETVGGVTGRRMIKFTEGGVYTVFIYLNSSSATLNFLVVEDVPPRKVSMLWQVFQFLLLSLGEVMFSISGLEFAYSQSPHSMKSCIMAGWLLTVSVGNLIVVILEGVKPTDGLSIQFFFFAVLLAVVMILFILMTYFYTYVDYGCVSEIAEEESEEKDAEESPLLAEQDDPLSDKDSLGMKED